jgi:RimK family alpha-L-glutamate ligase
MNTDRLKRIGLLSSDPWSRRVQSLESALTKRGVDVLQVLPWKVVRSASTGRHSITHEGHDLAELDMLLVLDLGANDIGSFFNRVGLLSALAEMGVSIVNSVNSILSMRNKAETLRKLVSAELPVPETLITESIDVAAEFVREHFPCVLKPITGFGGLGVQLIERGFDLENIHDYLKFHSQMFGKGAYLLQEYVRSPGYDIRALVLDGEVISSMRRIGTDGITTNIHSGGIPQRNDTDVSDIAIRSARSVKGRLVGVDIIPDLQGNHWVIEVNATPGWSGLQQVTDFDIADRLAEKLSLA